MTKRYGHGGGKGLPRQYWLKVYKNIEIALYVDTTAIQLGIDFVGSPLSKIMGGWWQFSIHFFIISLAVQRTF